MLKKTFTPLLQGLSEMLPKSLYPESGYYWFSFLASWLRSTRHEEIIILLARLLDKESSHRAMRIGPAAAYFAN